jgi:hypothetical protein
MEISFLQDVVDFFVEVFKCEQLLYLAKSKFLEKLFLFDTPDLSELVHSL